MISREVRSFGDQEGVVYTQGAPEQNYTMTKRRLGDRVEDFFDGTKIIKQ